MISHENTKCTFNIAIMSNLPMGTKEIEILNNLPKEANVIINNLEGFKKASDDEFEKIEILLLFHMFFDIQVIQILNIIIYIEKYYRKLKNIKWIHTMSVGINKLCIKEILDTDVIITNNKGLSSHSLAEYALFACNYFAKQLPVILAAQKSRIWKK